MLRRYFQVVSGSISCSWDNTLDMRTQAIWVCWHEYWLVLLLAFLSTTTPDLPCLVGLADARGDAIRLAYEAMGGSVLQVPDPRSTNRLGATIDDLTRHIRNGSACIIAPDGPRGPARKPRAGAGILSSRAQVPLIPVRVEVKPALRLRRRWDQLVIPLPASRVRVKPDLDLTIASLTNQ